MRGLHGKWDGCYPPVSASISFGKLLLGLLLPFDEEPFVCARNQATRTPVRACACATTKVKGRDGQGRHPVNTFRIAMKSVHAVRNRYRLPHEVRVHAPSEKFRSSTARTAKVINEDCLLCIAGTLGSSVSCGTPYDLDEIADDFVFLTARTAMCMRTRRRYCCSKNNASAG